MEYEKRRMGPMRLGHLTIDELTWRDILQQIGVSFRWYIMIVKNQVFARLSITNKTIYWLNSIANPWFLLPTTHIIFKIFSQNSPKNWLLIGLWIAGVLRVSWMTKAPWVEATEVRSPLRLDRGLAPATQSERGPLGGFVLTFRNMYYFHSQRSGEPWSGYVVLLYLGYKPIK
jgi:hypothetical protein